MKFHCKIDKLRTALTPALSCAMSQGQRKDWLGGKLILTAVGGKITTRASGGPVSAVSQFDFNPKHFLDGQVLCVAKDLNAALKSFEKDEMVVVTTGKGDQGLELRVAREAEDDDATTLPCELVYVPTIPFSFRIALTELERAAKVVWAIGGAKDWQKYSRWLLRVSPTGYRSCAGDGKLFMAYNREGKSVVEAAAVHDLYLTAIETEALLRALSAAGSKQVEIVAVTDLSNPHIEFRAGESVFCVSTADPVHQYPEVDRIANRRSRYQFTTLTTDWNLPMAGMKASEKAAHHRHGIVMQTANLDFKRRSVSLIREGTTGALRKVAMHDATVAEGSQPNLSLRLEARALHAMFRHGKASKSLQIEVEDDASPVVVRFQSEGCCREECWSNDPASHTRERMTMMIAALPKKAVAGDAP